MKIGIKKGDNIIVEVSGKEPDLVLSRVSEMFKNKFGEN
jgi:phosphotransferase system HPr-like phosphotransfer protein